MKRLAVYLKPYRRELVLSVLCVVLECAFELVIPLIMAGIIDTGVMRRDKPYIVWQSVLMLFCALLALLLGAEYARTAARAGQGFGAELREAEFEKIQSFSFSNLDHFSDASLITRMTSDVNILQTSLCNGIRPLVRGPVMLVLALGLSIAMSPRLTLVFVAATPVLAVGLFLILRAMSPVYRSMQKALDAVNSIVRENLTAIRTVKAYVKGGSESEKFAAANGEYRSTSERAFRYATMNLPYFQLVMYATVVSILWFGGGFIREGSLQVGSLTGFLSYVLQILNSLMMISSVFLMLSRAVTSVSRIGEVLEEPAGITDASIVDAGTADTSIAVRRGEIEFRHVSFKYRSDAEEDVLLDISLRIPAGKTVGILGGTGSAKTSLVQLIPRLYDVTGGQLLLDGRDVREYPLAPLRGAVGMVLQNNTLFSGTIRENLRWGDESAAQADLDWACHIACADEFLGRFPDGYDTDLGQGGVNVSGGQKQRLCIARALLKRPRVLILDDSTSAVDTATEAKIRRRLAEALPETTKILITQRVASVEDADLLVILDDGKISFTGTQEEALAESAIYRELYETQRKGATA